MEKFNKIEEIDDKEALRLMVQSKELHDIEVKLSELLKRQNGKKQETKKEDY